MASSLERSLYPQAGLTPTSGVQYFGNTGRGIAVDYFSSRPVNNVNAGFTTPAAAAYESPESGFVQTPTEGGFGGGESASAGTSSGGGISPGTAAGLGTAASLGGLAAGISGNQGLGIASGALGSVAAASQGNMGPAASMAAGLMGASPLGAAAIGLGVTGLSTGAVSNSTIGTTVAGLMGNAIAGPVGGFIGAMLAKGAADSAAAAQGESVANNVGMEGLGVGNIGSLGFGTTGTDTGADGTSGGIAAADGVGASGIGEGSVGSVGIGDGTGSGGDGPGSSVGGDGGGVGGGGDGGGVGGGGDGGGVGWADGGLIGDRPGITKRYADGGPLLAMGYAGGGRIAMGAVPSNASVNDRVNAILRNPQMRESIVARAQQLMDSGELTPEEVTTMGRVAEAAMFNPSLYPQLRQFVAAQGMTPLPSAYDPSVVTKIIATARALAQSTPAGQVPPTSAAAVTPAAPGMNRGGMIRGPGTGRSDSIGTVNESTGEPVRVANGEYIIPEHVVRAKGQEFFDNLLRRYADVPKES